MLYNLLAPLAEDISIFNVFRYLTFRSGGAVLFAFFLTLVIGPSMIRWLKRLQREGQPIRSDGPESHLLTKKGTPTMGGLMFLLSASITTLLWADIANIYVWVVLFVTIGYGSIGFADDFLKLTKRNSKGLNGRFKLVGQASIGLVATVVIVYHQDATIPQPAGLATSVALPFFKDVLIPLGFGFLVFGTLVMMGASNAVNLTDGLDGLATVPVMIAAACFALHLLSRGQCGVRRVSAAAFRAGLGRTCGLLRRALRRRPRLPVVQRAAGHGVHGRYRVPEHGWGLGCHQRHHQA
jgi:phospho-N-acetylmuramoyl-pentapeptide-transferase